MKLYFHLFSVQELLESGSSDQFPNTAATLSDLRSLSSALLESLNDKTLALSHQKKANRILAARIAELEQRLESLQGAEVITFPSKVLLDGYVSADVDKDLGVKFVEDLTVHRQNEIKQESEVAQVESEG